MKYWKKTVDKYSNEYLDPIFLIDEIIDPDSYS